METILLILTLVFTSDSGQVMELDQWIEPERADFIACYSQVDYNHVCVASFMRVVEK